MESFTHSPFGPPIRTSIALRIPAAGPSGPRRVPKPSAKFYPATFQCSLCPKRYTRAYNLRSHLRTHIDERPYVCTICGMGFARQYDRKRHERLTHLEHPQHGPPPPVRPRRLISGDRATTDRREIILYDTNTSRGFLVSHKVFRHAALTSLAPRLNIRNKRVHDWPDDASPAPNRQRPRPAQIDGSGHTRGIKDGNTTDTDRISGPMARTEFAESTESTQAGLESLVSGMETDFLGSVESAKKDEYKVRPLHPGLPLRRQPSHSDTSPLPSVQSFSNKPILHDSPSTHATQWEPPRGTNPGPISHETAPLSPANTTYGNSMTSLGGAKLGPSDGKSPGGGRLRVEGRKSIVVGAKSFLKDELTSIFPIARAPSSRKSPASNATATIGGGWSSESLDKVRLYDNGRGESAADRRRRPRERARADGEDNSRGGPRNRSVSPGIRGVGERRYPALSDESDLHLTKLQQPERPPKSVGTMGATFTKKSGLRNLKNKDGPRWTISEDYTKDGEVVKKRQQAYTKALLAKSRFSVRERKVSSVFVNGARGRVGMRL